LIHFYKRSVMEDRGRLRERDRAVFNMFAQNETRGQYRDHNGDRGGRLLHSPVRLKIKNFSDTTPRKTKNEPMQESDYDLVPDIIEDSSSRGRQAIVKYQRLDVLGTGGFAKVYRVQDMNSGEIFADKVTSLDILHRRHNAKQKIDREISIHRSLDHVNIVKFYKYFCHENYIHMVMEICSNKTLLHVQKYRTRITEPEARFYLKQIMEGTRYLHSRQVLHRDLKLGNMFIHADMTIKIGDFGLATTFSGNKVGNMCGTPNYMAPEVLSKKGHGVQSDIWAIGCMLFALLCGSPPFETETLNATYKRILDSNFTIPSRINLSESARDMIEMMLSSDPDMRGHLAMPDRYQLDECDNLFSHSFLQNFTPAALPRSAIREIPNLEAEKHGQRQNFIRTKAISIKPRRPAQDVDVGYNTMVASLSPISPPHPLSPLSPPHTHPLSPISPPHTSPLSPSAFSPPQIGSSIKQKFGSFFDKRGRFIHRVIDSLSIIVEQTNKQSNNNFAPPSQAKIPIFVAKWVDYSNKFGFGYQLSNKAVGLQFTDTTKIMCTADRSLVEFLDMKGKPFTFPLKGPIPCQSKDLKLRVGVLECVINYMENNLHDASSSLQGRSCVTTTGKTLIPQMKKWNRRRDSVSMELNNHTIQVNHIEEHVKVVASESGGDVYITLLEHRDPAIIYSLNSLLNLGCPPRLGAWLEVTLPEIRHLADKE